MKPIVAVFIDALKPESIKHMEFLNTFESKVRVKTELPSYSSPCHGSMYTGVYPEKHQHFFIWKKSSVSSPFKLFSKLGVDKIFRNAYIKYMLYATVCKLKYGIVPYGYLFFSKHPLNFLANFDFEMVKFWGNPDIYIGGYPTIFKFLTDAEVKYQVIWKPKGPLNDIHLKSNLDPFTYVFIGHMDPISHRFGQESSEAKTTIRSIDKVLEKIYLKFKRAYRNDFYFVVLSDHGQTKIKDRVDLYSYFKSIGRDLNHYLHFIDSCYARFWFRNEKEGEEIEEALNNLIDKGFGFILTDKLLKKFHARMPKNEYGDLIFYLEPPYVFDVVDPKAVSMHGYIPSYAALDGVCVANKVINRSYIKLEDMVPSILQALDLQIPDYMDGEPLWK